MKITKKIKKIEERLKALAQADYKHPVALETHIAPGPFQIPVMTVCYPKAHPGTGMRRVLLDDAERSYGRHGEGDVADLMRARGLVNAGREIDPQQLLRLVNIAYYDGIALLVNPDPRLTASDKGLKLSFFRTLHPSGERLRVVFEVKASGNASLIETKGK